MRTLGTTCEDWRYKQCFGPLHFALIVFLLSYVFSFLCSSSSWFVGGDWCRERCCGHFGDHHCHRRQVLLPWPLVLRCPPPPPSPSFPPPLLSFPSSSSSSTSLFSRSLLPEIILQLKFRLFVDYGNPDPQEGPPRGRSASLTRRRRRNRRKWSFFPLLRASISPLPLLFSTSSYQLPLLLRV